MTIIRKKIKRRGEKGKNTRIYATISLGEGLSCIGAFLLSCRVKPGYARHKNMNTVRHKNVGAMFAWSLPFRAQTISASMVVIKKKNAFCLAETAWRAHRLASTDGHRQTHRNEKTGCKKNVLSRLAFSHQRKRASAIPQIYFVETQIIAGRNNWAFFIYARTCTAVARVPVPLHRVHRWRYDASDDAEEEPEVSRVFDALPRGAPCEMASPMTQASAHAAKASRER